METKPDWYTALSPREQATIDHAREYARSYAHAGVPGHSAHLLLAKLADLLDGAPQQVQWKHAHWDEASNCWRDTSTGVKVEA